MSIFVDYLTNPFSGLSNEPTTILETTTNTLWVQAIVITNLGEEDIRINLQLVRTATSNVTINLMKNLLVPSYKNPLVYKDTVFNTVDLVKLLGIPLNLEFGTGLSDSLVIFSNGYTQLFDCAIIYSRLNELPMTSC